MRPISFTRNNASDDDSPFLGFDQSTPIEFDERQGSSFAPPTFALTETDGESAIAGPDGMAAGGKKGGGSGNGSGGGTVSGTTSGGTTTTTGGSTTTTTGGSTTTTTGGSTTTTTSGGTSSLPSTFKAVTVEWKPLNAPAGDSTPPTDTLFGQQWGLTNKAAGIDVVTAWQNYTGKGVKVGVVDDGFDYTHVDLAPNYLLNLDYDARTGGNDAFGDPTADGHGTTVMGVIGADRNGVGVVGVAYDAGVTGFRIGYLANGSMYQIADAINHAVTNGMDVINNSWAYQPAYSDNFYVSAFATSKSAIQNAVANGRNGLGIDVVFGAGNSRYSGDNVNYHNFQNDPLVITVGGTDSYGHVTAYSTPGAALLVSAPGTAMTDDRVGSYGYVDGDYVNGGGTSYAAPYVSGVVALMLQANPLLGYRDVMEILAYSARNSDPSSPGWQTNDAHDWNGGGLHFNADYGFGMVDATAAVRLAESWQKQSTYSNLSSEGVAHTDNLAIPDGSGSVSSTISLGSSLRLDKVVVDLNITHANAADLTVTLTSPWGTNAVLASHPANGSGTGIVFETSANTFWGEDAKGNWTLTVTDSVAGNTGTLNGWTLQALGDSPNTPNVYIYTDEFASAAGSGRDVLHDTSGLAGINTAAVTSGSYLDLNPGASDTIAGRTLQIGTDTMLKTAWGGDGNDIIIANAAGDMIEAGRGDDKIFAGTGADKLWGGPGNDTFVFTTANKAMDVISDFARGSDVIDMRQALAATGYTGNNAVNDHWLVLTPDGAGTGTNISIDAHDGKGAQAVVDVIGVAPALLTEGVDYLTKVA